jgi:hypothetical protein
MAAKPKPINGLFILLLLTDRTALAAEIACSATSAATMPGPVSTTGPQSREPGRNPPCLRRGSPVRLVLIVRKRGPGAIDSFDKKQRLGKQREKKR